MTLGKLTGKKTADSEGNFTGMDITGVYLDPNKGYARTVSFHYAFYSNNFRGLVEKVLDAVLKGKETPKNISNVEVI